MRNFIIMLVFALGAALCPISSPARAADEPMKILDSTVSKYRDSARQWEPVLKVHAKRLFFILCVISLVFTAGWGFLRGNMGIGDFFSEFVRFGITMGIFYWLLENGPTMAKAIIDSMTLMGQEASSTYVVQLTPSDICTQGFGILYDALAEFGKSDYSTGIMVIVLALVVAIVFGVIAAQMVVLLCSSWILIYGGVFYLGFGGGNWTSDIAKNYFKTILAQAMQVFTFCLLIGIGQTEIYNLTSSLRITKSVTVANYWYMFGVGGGSPTKVVETESLTLASMCVCLVFAVILVILVSRVPGLVAGIITGSSITAMAFGGVGGAMGSASGIISGGSMIAAQASGAGLALATAYKQTVANMDSGGGDLSGMSSAGSLGGGLTGAMSSGLAFAYDFAANLASGSAGSVKDDLQQSTIGGKISAVIEADAQTGDGGGNRPHDSEDSSSADTAAASSENVSAEREGGDGTDMGEGIAQSDAGSDSGSAMRSADGGGIAPQRTGAENHGDFGPAIGDVESNNGVGGSMDNGPVFEGGGISSGVAPTNSDSEWDNAIANYDPKNVGRPDGDIGGDKAWNDAIRSYDPKNIGRPDDS